MRFRLKHREQPTERPGEKPDAPKRGALRNFAGALIVSGLMAFGCQEGKAPDNAQDLQAFRNPPAAQVQALRKKLLVLTREKFRDAMGDYLEKKRGEGYDARLATLEEIPQDGRDAPESIRDYLRREKEENGLDYLLIVGDADPGDYLDGVINHAIDKDWEIPMRHVSVEGKPYSEGPAELEDYSHDTIFPTDQYYVSLDGTWDANGNGIYGEAGAMEDEFGLRADVSVGRFPVRTVEELQVVLDSNSAWEVRERPVHSVFKGKYCAPEYSEEQRADTQARTAESQLPEVRDVRVHVCYGDSGGDIAEFLNADGSDFATSVSHGWLHGITMYGTGDEAYGYRLDYASANIEKPPVYFAYACLVGAIDQESDVLAERLLKSGQVVAFIGATRSHADVHFDFWNDAYFEKDYALGDAFHRYKERLYSTRVMTTDEKGNQLMFNLFGDPALAISERPQIRVSVPGAVEIEAYYPDVPVFLRNNSESAMNVRAKYVISSSEIPIFEDHLEPAEGASFSFEHHLDSTLDKYIEAKIVAENDYSNAVSVSRIVFFSRHIVKGPFELYAMAGEDITVPVLVSYGADENVTIKAEFYPGCYNEGCDIEGREHFQAYSGTFSLAGGRKLPVTFTMPENANPYVPGTGYGLPQMEFSCEGCSGSDVTYVYYIE